MLNPELKSEGEKTFSRLSQQQYFLEKIVNHMRAGIAAYDLDGRYTFWNESMAKMTGKSSQEVLGQLCWEVFPFIRTTVLNCVKRAIQGERSSLEAVHFVVEGTGRDGYVDTNYEPLFDDGGKVVGAMAVVRDITDRYRAERALAESELKYRSLTQFAVDAIIMCDSSGKILSWNMGAQEIFQYKESEIIGRNISEIIPGNFWENYLIDVRGGLGRDALARHGRLSEIFGIRKIGSRFPMDITFSAWNSRGQIFFSVLGKDISDRRHLETIAEEREDLYAALLRAQSDLGEGVIITSVTEGKILHINDTMCELFGYTREELMALPNAWGLAAPDQLELLNQRHQMRMQRGLQRDHVETIGLRKDGSRFYMEFAMTFEETSYGPVAVNIIRDITKRKKAELELAEARRFTSQIVKSASDLICTISLDGAVMTLSPSFEAVSGWKPDEWIGKDMFSLIHPDDMTEAKEKVSKVFEGQNVVAKARCLKKNGQYTWVECSFSPVMEEGRIVGILSIGRDISQRP